MRLVRILAFFFAIALFVVLPPSAGRLLPVGMPATLAAAPLDRVQLYRNGQRGVPYLPLARQGASAGRALLAMRAIKTISLDGDALQNVYSNLYPIDVDGNGAYEFVQFNGYRFMQVWNAAGQKLWRITIGGGRLHDYLDGTHRDTLAVLDLDGDGKQDIAHCWASGMSKLLVFRRGRDGAVLRSIKLDGDANEPCQMAAFRLASTRQTVLLVSHEFHGTPKCKVNGYIDSWAQAVAFDLQGRKLWATRTCDAGHYVYPLDTNFDGYVEGVFVGKYLLRNDGSIKCMLATWPAADHTDAISVADLDPSRPGLEAAAAGRTGLALFDTNNCQQIWRISTAVVRDPQHVTVAKLDPSSPTPQLVVDERGSVKNARSYVISGKGKILAATKNIAMPMQNANLDGAAGVDEHVGSFGMVTDLRGTIRLARSWYWNLRGAKVRETNRGPYPSLYDRWQAFPLVFDYDRDGRDEIVQWGQSAIVVGKAY